MLSRRCCSRKSYCKVFPACDDHPNATPESLLGPPTPAADIMSRNHNKKARINLCIFNDNARKDQRVENSRRFVGKIDFYDAHFPILRTIKLGVSGAGVTPDAIPDARGCHFRTPPKPLFNCFVLHLECQNIFR